jgi:hypothetical protein
MHITTLIPAYKTRYIHDLLRSLRCQTRQTRTIIVSDDSPNGEFREAFHAPEFASLRTGLNIEFHDGPRNGAYENVKHLVRLWGGRSELLHIMLDDDVMYPEFYERHLLAHGSGEFSCSVSRRWIADEDGLPTSCVRLPPAIASSPNRMISLDDTVMFLTTVADFNNYLGEFSNAVFRADTVELLLEPAFCEVSYAGLWDLGAFIAASMRRPLCHIQDTLGFFRVSAGQNSSNVNSPYMKGALLGWVALAVAGRRTGRLSEALMQHSCRILVPTLNVRYGNHPDMQAFCGLVPEIAAGSAGAEDRFITAWNGFLAEHGF